MPEGLALLNAVLNGTAGVLILNGRRAIAKKNVVRHRGFMLTALATSTLFLMSYTTRMIIAGDTHFQGQGPLRWFYFAVLITHVLAAIGGLPLILRAVFLAIRGRIEAHRKIVRWAYPVWVYVSVTGVLVYLMLYQLFPAG
ncbi:MAG: DUF420 domain-containing protein [Myxococcales bacterium]|nr:DUF420 domain-containing protein [Myxococcales bacterium]